PLAWNQLPAETNSLAIICHDPDAPLVSPQGTYGFVHWTLYNIPASTDSIPEAVDDYTVGRNDFGDSGYGGPMPPEGHGIHRYYCWLLAMKLEQELNAGLTLWELLEQTEPRIVGMNRLIGTFERS